MFRMFSAMVVMSVGVMAAITLPRPRVVRVDMYPKTFTLTTPGQTVQLCGFNVRSDSSRTLFPSQVGVPACDSMARIYTRAKK